uniref:Uncharacterized protein n=1 Tax=Timema cristinae TaxID=61476 RepID=A0A7R9HA82_TIMCR|nr:unnamed protein product [Timema cristinae]
MRKHRNSYRNGIKRGDSNNKEEDYKSIKKVKKIIIDNESMLPYDYLLLFGGETFQKVDTSYTVLTPGERVQARNQHALYCPLEGGIRPPSSDIGCFHDRSKNRKQLHCDDRHPICDQEDL